MGSLAGHVIPGCFFLFHGFLWAFLSIWIEHKSRLSTSSAESSEKGKRKGSTNTSTTSCGVRFFKNQCDQEMGFKSWIPFPCCPRVPLQPILKIILPLAGIIVESFFDYRNGHLVAVVYRVYWSNGQLNDMGKLHHITMYGAFLLSGIIDIIVLLVKLPRQTSMIMLSVAFWVEWMLFYSHSGNSDALSLHFHFILTLTIFACVVFAALRILHASHILINLGFSFCVFLQGTWFIQAGATLYPPSGSNALLESSRAHSSAGQGATHRVTMYVYALFTWHVMFIAVSLLLLWVVLSCCVRRSMSHCWLRKLQSKPNLVQNWSENERLVNTDEGEGKIDTVSIEMQEFNDI